MDDYSKLWEGRIKNYLFIYLFEGELKTIDMSLFLLALGC